MMLPTMLLSGYIFPYRKYADSIAGYFQYSSRSMVLHHCKSCDAQRIGVCFYLERNIDPCVHGFIFLILSLRNFKTRLE